MALNKTSSPRGYSAVHALGKLTLGEHITNSASPVAFDLGSFSTTCSRLTQNKVIFHTLPESTQHIDVSDLSHRMYNNNIMTNTCI